MSSRVVARLAATLVGLVAVAALLGVGVYAYLAYGGRSALNETLMAQRDGTPIPANVVFDSSHLSVHMRAEGRFSKLLRAGFVVSRPTFMWEAPQSLGAAYSIDVKEDIQLVCEVYRGKRWRIFCGQIRCASGDPCWFESPTGDRYRVLSERPDTSL